MARRLVRRRTRDVRRLAVLLGEDDGDDRRERSEGRRSSGRNSDARGVVVAVDAFAVTVAPERVGLMLLLLLLLLVRGAFLAEVPVVAAANVVVCSRGARKRRIASACRRPNGRSFDAVAVVDLVEESQGTIPLTPATPIEGSEKPASKGVGAWRPALDDTDGESNPETCEKDPPVWLLGSSMLLVRVEEGTITAGDDRLRSMASSKS